MRQAHHPKVGGGLERAELRQAVGRLRVGDGGGEPGAVVVGERLLAAGEECVQGPG